MKEMTEAEANAVYDVLVNVAGAHEHDRDGFVYHAIRPELREYRFIGHLGFGGKFWCYRMWRVDCYQEDLSPWRAGIIDKTNALLKELNDRRA